MAKIVRRLMRLFCAVVGHDWREPVAWRHAPCGNEADAITLYHTSCERCDVSIRGDWDWMEDNRAWKHYRRSL